MKVGYLGVCGLQEVALIDSQMDQLSLAHVQSESNQSIELPAVNVKQYDFTHDQIFVVT
jgi:hypothetical protein